MSDKNYLPDYRDKLGGRRFTSLSSVYPGDIVEFSYKGEKRIGMLLAANYKNKLHIISFKELPVSEFADMIQSIRPIPLSPQALYEKVRGLNESLDFGIYRQYLLRDVTQLQKILPKKEK